MTSMEKSGVWATIQGADLQRELRSRRSQYLYQTVRRSKDGGNIPSGWEVDRTNKQSLRLRKLKPVGDALEDELWTLMANMGFEEMNQGRTFKIPTGGDEKQIDVFARDVLSCLIISCKANSKWSRRSLQIELESLDHLSKRIRTEINKHFESDPPHFVGFVLATRNVDWAEEDERRAREWGIRVIKDEEIDYYSKLTSLIGHAARYQLMADLFEGQRIPKIRNRKVAAVKGRFKNTNFYQFVTDADTLASISFVQHRARPNRDAQTSYQRLVSKSKLASIAEYINEDMVFPTNIVINFQTDRPLRFEQAGLEDQADDGLTFGRLILPDSFKSAWIIDGQHRLLSYFHSKIANPLVKTRKQLPVIAFENLDRETEAQLFVDINSKQTKVRRDLLLLIKSDIDINSPKLEVQLDAICTRIALRLNTERRSPLHNRISSEQSASSETSVTLSQIQDALKRSRMIGAIDRTSGMLLPGPLFAQDHGTTVVRSVDILVRYMQLFKEGAEEHWELGNKRNTPQRVGGHLSSSRGVASLIYLLNSLQEEISSTFEDDFRQKSPIQFVESVSAYCKPVIDYFNAPSFEDIRVFKRQLGSTAPVNGMREMQKIINMADPSFNPEGLAEYIEAESASVRSDIQNSLNEIILDLTKIVVSFLKRKYPEGEEWFSKGLPLRIKTKVIEEHDKNTSRSYDQCFNMPTHAKEIIQNYGSELQSKFKAPDNKWLDELIRIRIEGFHPERDDRLQHNDLDYLENQIKPLIANGRKSLGLET